MALDTRNKRASVLGFALAALVVLPAPDATIDAADRQQVAFSYAGLLAGNPVVAPSDIVSLAANIRRSVAASADIRRSVSNAANLRRTVDVKVER